jgi:hypothetical protein
MQYLFIQKGYCFHAKGLLPFHKRVIAFSQKGYCFCVKGLSLLGEAPNRCRCRVTQAVFYFHPPHFKPQEVNASLLGKEQRATRPPARDDAFLFTETACCLSFKMLS